MCLASSGLSRAQRHHTGRCTILLAVAFVSGIILAVAPSKGIAILSPGSVARITCVCYQATCPYATTAAAIPTARQRWNYVLPLCRHRPTGPRVLFGSA
ncbi:hypothetical protein MRX96_028307 [Rhipicephalus microplus]